MSAASHDLVVIGAGPGGYVAAIRAAQLGLQVAVIEKEPALGGTCLRIGCIPSKALLDSSERYAQLRGGLSSHGIQISGLQLDLQAMLHRKDQVVQALTKGIDHLLKKNKITRYQGVGEIQAPGVVKVTGKESQEVQGKNILIATGSKSAPLPGVVLDGDKVGTSTEALSYPEVPKRLIVIGAGFIGLELGSVWSRLGSEVMVLEYLDRILPGMDAEIARDAQKIFEKQGLQFRLGVRVTGARSGGKGCVVETAGGEKFDCNRVLLAVGRQPNTEGLGLEKVGIKTDAKGRIEVDEHFRCSVPGFLAIGDVIRGPMLAHKAEEEGVACAEQLVRGSGHVDYQCIPGVVYTVPEIGTVGASEEELQKQNVPYRKGLFPFMANGRARALGETEGKVKVLAHGTTDRILGVHVIGPHAGDLVNEAATAMAFGATSEDLARACHAHPTLGEALKEAALAVDQRAIHI